jgi:RsiW-degrading membrane proteinase PrsW (M82 family)
MITSDPKTLGLAIVGGTLPALFWLWFWLKEDKEKPEPKGLIASVFFIGIISVAFVIPIQKFIQIHVASNDWQIIGWAAVEEIIKYLGVFIVLYASNRVEEPIDWPIFLITAALGFAALENTMFLIKPLSINETTVGLLTGQLRFLGSTLLHAVSSGIIGISLGLSFNMSKYLKGIYLIFGITLAIALHSIFNFFIMDNSGNDYLRIMGFLWFVTIIVMLLFEKLRRMSSIN